MKNKYYIGIDVGGTKIAGALITAKGIMVNRKKISSPRKAKPQDIVQAIRNLIKHLANTSSSKMGLV